MKKNFLIWAVCAALLIPSGPVPAGICLAQNEKASGVEIQQEKGPSGHSTIGIVENSIEKDDSKTLTLTFSRLMIWQYDADNYTAPPEKIEMLDGRKVKLAGFMYPV